MLNLPLASIWAKLLYIPRPYLYAGILFFASVGAYAVNQSTVDLMVLFVLGLIGFAMRRFGIPVVPAVIGVILGSRAETQMRRALQISDGEISGLFNTAFSVTIYAIIALIVLWPLINRLVVRPLRRRRATGSTTESAESAESVADQSVAAVVGASSASSESDQPRGTS